ncbi:ATP-binding protein [Leptolyngbya sp. ST-U4]|uniref:sensor histidine kinase n=1 Tax=Leptolyngbya sp. ST-U4 TaxID=2933912 RepID=UPI003298B17A
MNQNDSSKTEQFNSKDSGIDSQSPDMPSLLNLSELLVNSQALRPRARILRTLGDELISSEIVALIELVKNSYDADASTVLIRFQDSLQAGEGRIEVMDDGNGMSLSTIQKTWMEPATFSKAKKDQVKSERKGRRVLGEKGVGRFAASRLAKSLEVFSRRIGTNSEVRVFFDWSQFDNPEKYLDQIQIPYEEREPVEIHPNGNIRFLDYGNLENSNLRLTHGTILRMEELRITWGRQQIELLRADLSRLISPFFETDFKIRLEVAAPLEEYSGVLEPPEALKHPHYRIWGHIDACGQARLRLQLRGQQTEELIDEPFQFPDGRSPQCGPFDIDLRIWDRDQEALEDLAKLSGSRTRDIRRDLNNSAGISVYRDGFRVLPYGEPNNDWLRLDARRVQNPTMRVSVNQVVGYVLISADQNPDLRDQSNREGLMSGQALDDFRELIRMALARLEEKRYGVRHPKKTNSKSKLGGVFSGFSLAEIRNFVRRNQPNNQELLLLLDEQEKDLEHRIEVVQETLARYRRLAVLGQLIDALLHDGRTPLSKIASNAYFGLRDINRSTGEPQNFQLITKLKKYFEKIENQSNLLSTVFKRIEPFGGRKPGRPANTTLEEVISTAFDVMEGETRQLGVEVSLPETKTSVTVEPTEIQEVIVNLLNNSLYWLQRVPKEDRHIAVQCERHFSNEVTILFSDSGPGVDPEHRDRIFDPYFSTKPDGVGLGLAIAGEIIDEYYSGRLELLTSGPLPGATFRITLCKRV